MLRTKGPVLCFSAFTPSTARPQVAANGFASSNVLLRRCSSSPHGVVSALGSRQANPTTFDTILLFPPKRSAWLGLPSSYSRVLFLLARCEESPECDPFPPPTHPRPSCTSTNKESRCSCGFYFVQSGRSAWGISIRPAGIFRWCAGPRLGSASRR